MNSCFCCWNEYLGIRFEIEEGCVLIRDCMLLASWHTFCVCTNRSTSSWQKYKNHMTNCVGKMLATRKNVLTSTWPKKDCFYRVIVVKLVIKKKIFYDGGTGISDGHTQTQMNDSEILVIYILSAQENYLSAHKTSTSHASQHSHYFNVFCIHWKST